MLFAAVLPVVGGFVALYGDGLGIVLLTEQLVGVALCKPAPLGVVVIEGIDPFDVTRRLLLGKGEGGGEPTIAGQGEGLFPQGVFVAIVLLRGNVCQRGEGVVLMGEGRMIILKRHLSGDLEL